MRFLGVGSSGAFPCHLAVAILMAQSMLMQVMYVDCHKIDSKTCVRGGSSPELGTMHTGLLHDRDQLQAMVRQLK
jgi:hypothetical protein